MHRFLLAAAACCFCLSATAQWQWLDKDGRKVFSDRPPPADIPDKNILRQPNMRAPAAAPTQTAPAAQSATSASPAAAPPKPSGKDKELEKKKAQAEAEEAAKAKAEEERKAEVRADNCERARRAKTTYESGLRIVQTNAQGEQIVVDDAARAQEIQRLDGIIASNCGSGG